MAFDRRQFIALAAGGVAAGFAPSPLRARAASTLRFEAIAFDAFPILDPRPIGALTERMFPGRGNELHAAWRTRQFEYQWLRALAGRYVDFWQATAEGLDFAAKQLQLDLTADRRDQLMQAWLELRAWPDAAGVLRALRERGVRLVFLSNMTRNMLDAGIRNSGLDDVFEQVLSTGELRSYKPDPRAYQLGIDALRLRREEVLFAAFAGWDVAGAKWFGYPTFWVNRLEAPAEVLGVTADATGRDLVDLQRFVLRAG